MSYKKIMIISGEMSGDALGAPLINLLKSRYPGAEFFGVGGAEMLKAAPDFECFFEMNDLAVMGLAEVLPALPRILNRLKICTEEALKRKPDLIITIDAPDFNFRLVKKLRKKEVKSKVIHYVAPSVWAWRAGRAQKIAKLYDGLFCLLPFEPPYFTPHSLKAEYVGHPALRQCMQARGEYKADQRKQVALLFGSRKGEFNRHCDVFADTLKILSKEQTDIHYLIPAVPHLKPLIEERLNNLNLNISYEFTDPAQRYQIYARADYAISVSGTAGLELALCATPHCVLYRVNAITGFIAKRLIKTPYAHLANIVLQEAFIPEFIQEHCQATLIAEEALRALTTNQKQSAEFQEKIEQITNIFEKGDLAAALDKLL